MGRITLNRHGITHIETTRQAAEALRPFAGKFAATLSTVGIVGVGFLAIPTLAGSVAYAFAETLGWRKARAFYTLILLSTGGRRIGLRRSVAMFAAGVKKPPLAEPSATDQELNPGDRVEDLDSRVGGGALPR